MNPFYKKKILVTGGSGSIGSGIVKSLLNKKCSTIRVMSHDENGIYELSEDISRSNKKFQIKMIEKKIRFIIGDIRDLERCKTVTQGIDIVIHAAALKHVPICEYNPGEAFKTNVIGTQNLIKASIKNKVKKFLFISTDKTAEPTSVMGKTKLEAERKVLLAKSNITKFSIIRFGNILFSRGSVPFKFIKQIKLNEPITLTGDNVSRFFILISTAVEKIFKTILLMKGGEVFIINNMEAFKIIDLAKALNFVLKKNNKIKIIGLREGEKSFEQLISSKEYLTKIPNIKDLMIITKKINKNRHIVDSRYAKHLSVKKIIKILQSKNQRSYLKTK